MRPARHRLVILVILTCAAGAVRAQDAPSADAGSPYVDPRVWQSRLSAWVETFLIQEQLDAAASALEKQDTGEVLRVTERLITAHVQGQREPARLPPESVPATSVRGLKGIARDAARLVVRGKTEEALTMLEEPAALGDASAAHLVAQLLDEASLEQGPVEQLAAVRAYRYALSLERQSKPAQRARVRVGQLFLRLGFAAESMASLRPWSGERLAEPFRSQAAVTLTEAAYLGGDPREVLGSLEHLDPARLSAQSRRWAELRRADSLFRLQRYGRAIEIYRQLQADPEIDEVDGASRLRLAFALLKRKQLEEAERELDSLWLGPDSPQQPVAGLLRAWAAERGGDVPRMSDVAMQVIQRFPEQPESALAGIYVREAKRLGGSQDALPPETLRALVDYDSDEPEIGLLSHLYALRPVAGTHESEVHRQLGTIVLSQPHGPVHRTVHRELARRILFHLHSAEQAGRDVEGALLDDAEKYLQPERLDVDALLLGTQAFVKAGRTESCATWANHLRTREVRPLRRGVGAWRQVQCSIPPGTEAADVLVTLADSGEAGPFSLAVAALGAERALEVGDVDRALEVYRGALESFVEPRLLGPVLLRIGELEAGRTSDALAMRHLMRGLALTDSAATAADPFRKAGIVALSRIAGRSDRKQRLRSLIRHEQLGSDEWWSQAYGYLGHRAGVASVPGGDGVFTEGARELAASSALTSEIRDVIAEARTELERREALGR